MPSASELQKIKTALVNQALALGFTAVGVTGAEPLQEEGTYLQRWLAKQYHGTMKWMETHASQRSDPRAFFPQAQSVVMVALSYYRSREPLIFPPESGTISLYARGRDYHKIIRKKLKQLLEWLKEQMPETEGRIFVDSFPVLERALAQRAGLGWIGKNAMLILKGKGSWFFLGGMFLNLPLPPDEPLTHDYCGSCNRCLEACPTRAIVAPREVDARRCISYLTIEHHGEIAEEFHSGMGNYIFGCDICQAVCPWNRFARDTRETDFSSRFTPQDLRLSRLINLKQEEFEKMFQGTPVRRAGYQRFRQNVGIAQQNLASAAGSSGEASTAQEEQS